MGHAFGDKLDAAVERVFPGVKSVIENTIREGFTNANRTLAETFEKSLNEVVVPQISKSFDDAKNAVMERVDRWVAPSSFKEAITSDIADMERYIKAGDYDGLYKEIDGLQNQRTKAEKYKDVAKICIESGDKHNAYIAANRYKQLEGEDPKAYQFLGYVYWWFGDPDTGIAHTEKALELANSIKNGNEKSELLCKLKNNLAFYYAEEGIKGEKAVNFIDEALKSTARNSIYYTSQLDTAGYVHYKFGKTKVDMDSAVGYFLRVLELEPDNPATLQHLKDAYKKKRDLPS